MFCHNQYKKYASYRAGFSLVELMIVVAIVAILAAIALPNYNKYIVAGHRTDAQAAMLNLAQYLERQYNTSFSYPTIGNIPTSLKAPANISDYYTLSIDPYSDQSFTIKATPTSKQNDSQCGTLTLNEQGVKSPTTNGCWK